jgi:hypothetical protein
MTSTSDEKWRHFKCFFFSRVELRTYQHPYKYSRWYSWEQNAVIPGKRQDFWPIHIANSYLQGCTIRERHRSTYVSAHGFDPTVPVAVSLMQGGWTALWHYWNAVCALLNVDGFRTETSLRVYLEVTSGFWLNKLPFLSFNLYYPSTYGTLIYAPFYIIDSLPSRHLANHRESQLNWWRSCCLSWRSRNLLH